MNKHPFTTYIEPKVAEFEKLTGIKVVIEAFPEDQYRNKLTIELNSGGKVDGYMIMPGQDDLYYSKAGWLQPLDAYIADPKLTDASWDPKDFFASFAKASSVDGKQIGVVINAETSLLAYRKDLFTKFKQKVPTTMKELEAVAKFFYGKEVDGKKLVGITLRGKGRRPPPSGSTSSTPSAAPGPTPRASRISLRRRTSRRSSSTAIC